MAKFRITWILLWIVLIAVSLGWMADRYRYLSTEPMYAAQILQPEELARVSPTDDWTIEVVFRDYCPNSKLTQPPIVTADLWKKDGVERYAMDVWRRGTANPAEYTFTFQQNRKQYPLLPGTYLLRLRFEVDGVVVATPSRMILVEEAEMDQKTKVHESRQGRESTDDSARFLFI